MNYNLCQPNTDGKNHAVYSAISASQSGSGDWYWIGLQEDTIGAWVRYRYILIFLFYFLRNGQTVALQNILIGLLMNLDQ